MDKNSNEFEIMAPVGSRESLAAAIHAGADSVYFGIGRLNMRSHSANHFTIDDLKEIAGTCKAQGIKTYLTVNTVIYGERCTKSSTLPEPPASLPSSPATWP